ncbi:DsbE family thiol:disulfide interchange protein [Vibrio sp. V27_P1S3P104]|uniref:DsbE family thiol:disulfide interchange protein n=1 Tax=unclassified Vibrio TaxID=2614977 RepID=UPI00137347BC|nr:MULTISPECIES: DsbE family thiol:disulfide interchange protein [unclassified Vibrio]NAW68734.1 DsbE family thiol:disulfide interchange protein [Vibrio sp. V28_P6S34P95]NAX04559.1 DsbE family thiol:disulfide interchange protein [Vibrio sp. V30_P3S12P165]NAX33544.1 DsbE family thiol:disulfide interchange protein [Vibrio sp. V29_P1S30P107]NAX38769.1 DsbE family thiol:disulfide interchange protein [Vibrio sp. V27_P1S3P104]NAX40990.1 DsbE family thiol:disulfide interchange protein [Vibrio sp. V26
MHKKVLFIPLLAFLLLVAIFVTQLMKNSAGDNPTKLESVLIGKVVPEFKLEDLAEPGRLYDQSIFIGKPLLLNVWATWCPTCYAEHQYLNQLADQGVKIIGLNYKDQRDKAVTWLNELGNPYLISLFDGSGMLGLDLGVYGAPETFLIDAHGVIRYRHVGDVNPHHWKNQLEPIYQQLVQESQP